MKNNRFRPLLVAAFLIFLLTLPFLQSLFFSSGTQGSVVVNKEIKADYIKSDKKIILLFFGYAGCRYVCTPDLEKIADLYESKELKGVKGKIDVFFVNLTPEAPEYAPELFAKSFNADFKGVYLSKNDILKIDRNFGLFFSDDLSEKGALNHSDNLYLIQNTSKEKVLKEIYFMHPLNTKKIVDDIISLDKTIKVSESR